jgi:AmmeMemoRadiSam system protein B
MPSLDRPCLRAGLAAAQDDKDPCFYVIWDQRRLSRRQQRVNLLEFACVQLFDGRRTVRQIQDEVMRQAGGILVPIDALTALVAKMDEALFLDGPRFRQHLSSPIREPSCIGCYAGEPAALRAQLHLLFTDPNGPGLPREQRPERHLRAALLPHIDYARGGLTFTWGFKEVFEQTEASLFVIIATSHYSAQRYILTRQDFKTPLGIVPTDQDYIDRLLAHYGDGLFDDEFAHVPEHSIELEVVFLQYLYEGRRPIRIVPLLTGGYHDCVRLRLAPTSQPDIARMVEALRRVETEIQEPICYLISGDFAHIGPKFGDPRPVGSPLLEHSRAQDGALLRRAEAADPLGFFQVIAEEGDCRRICGLPPTYVALEATRPDSGKVLHYDQYVHPQGYESVSFASVAFYRE